MITFVCGYLCAGKSLYSSALASATNGEYIEIGDIVKNLVKSNDRRILQTTSSLDKQIIDILQQKIITCRNGPDLIISGARQLSVVKAFPDANFLWISCPREIRKLRYYARRREGDSQTFEEAEQGDLALGINQVRQYILEQT